ncbi:MAG: VOC family protein [Pseudomonadota bacterium]|nr:VOC family protein [Pseudomonadota bacterium]
MKRYIVNDVEETIAFYTSKLGFELKKSFAPAVTFLGHGDLTLLVSGAMASASPCSMARYPVREAAGTGSSWNSTIWSPSLPG